jgi:aspartyl-tRNA(Asn)/glutamyl-tRNA(Gln) amidotransferase subunit B
MTKVEVKNMNSFRAVFRALEYEEKRQRKAVETGKRLVQETRGWVEEKGITVSQRSKEYAHDYRYFPEPDIPPITLTREEVEAIRAKLPELPEAKRDRFMADYGLPLYDANLLTAAKELAEYEEQFIAAARSTSLPSQDVPKLGSNWILGEISRIMNAGNIDIAVFREKVDPEKLVRLAVLNAEGKVSAATAKSILEQMYTTGKNPDALLKEGDLGQISDSDQITQAASDAIAANPQAVADFRAGKEQAVKFLVGHVMKATKGRANPQMVTGIIKNILGEE